MMIYSILKSIGIWLIMFASVYWIVKGMLEFKIYTMFEEKNPEMILRFSGMISFGLTNIYFIIFYNL